MSYARPVAARSSIAWTFDETRATMQELRRQLQIEKEVSRDAERERDELARELSGICLLYTSPSPRDGLLSRMPSSA